MASRAVKARSRRRLRQFLEVHGDLTPGQSFLELRAVQPKSAGLYKQSLLEFTEWATVKGKRLVEDDEVDDALVGYMNEGFFCRSARPCGRKTHGKSDVGGSRVLEDRTPDHAQSVGMPAPVPISIEKALHTACVGGDGEPAHTTGAQACGSRTTSGFAVLLQTGGAGESSQTRLDRCEERSLGQLEFNNVSVTKKPPDKNRGLGRQCPPALRVAGLDETAMATFEKWCERRQAVAFRSPGMWNPPCPSKTLCRRVRASTSASKPELWTQ